MPDWVVGIDVSAHQGTIDWHAVKAAGIQYAFIKTSEGTGWVDPKWYQNRDGAKAAGIPWAGYHFARPDTKPGDARQEAQSFIKYGGHLGPLPAVLDLEETTMNRDQTIQWAADFCDELERVKPQHYILYAGAFFLGQAIAADFRLRKCFWWLPNYGAGGDNPDPKTLRLPATNNPIGENWDIWQYTSRGHVPGIGGGRADVDMNVMERAVFNRLFETEMEMHDMTPEEYRLETTGQVELPVRDFLENWINNARRHIYVILDGRTGKYWAVHGLMRMEIQDESWAGWWAERPDVNPVYKYGALTDGKFIAMIDQSAIVEKDEDGSALFSVSAEIDVQVDEIVEETLVALEAGEFKFNR
jgi:GH25 family lysozyme M1 (1,4-beta-N-acetylmuramidase)